MNKSRYIDDIINSRQYKQHQQEHKHSATTFNK